MKKKKNQNSKSFKFTEEKMKEAVLKVIETGMPINRVSREKGLCKKTVKSYVDKYLNCAEAKKKTICFKANYEINQVFTNELEMMFENQLLATEQTKRKLNRSVLRDTAYEFATKCNVHVPKTWNIRKKAGLDWMYGFLSRHPRIKRTIIENKKSKLKSSEPEEDVVCKEASVTSIENIRVLEDVKVDCCSDSEMADAFEGVETRKESLYSYLKLQPSKAAEDELLTPIRVKSLVDEFKENLISAYSAIACGNCVPSERVYNLDEIALVVENPPFYNSNNVVVTACCFVNAAGTSQPPFMVFPRRNFKPKMLSGFMAGVNGVARKTGLVDGNVFVDALRHLRDVTNASPNHKITVIVEDDEYHVTIASLDFCQTHGIELVTVPPHSAKELMPIGQRVFKMLKACFNDAYERFRVNNPGAFISMYDVSALFCAIYQYAFTVDKIVAGFQDSGVYPLDVNALANPNTTASDNEPPLERVKVELVPTGIEDSDDEQSGKEECVSPELWIDFDPSSQYTRINRSPMDEFYKNLTRAYDSLREDDALRPERVFNMDEIELVAGTTRSGNVRVLVCCCANAAGEVIPPFLVYPELTFDSDTLNVDIEGMKAVVWSPKLEASEVFVWVLEHFRDYVGACPEYPTTLIVDTDASHVTINSIDFARENGIQLVTVPPHISQPFQPLEKTVFRLLMTNFWEACDRMTRTDAGREVTAQDIAKLLDELYPKTFTIANIVDGFRLTGLWPLDRTLFPNDVFCSSYTKETKEVTGDVETNELTDTDTASECEDEPKSQLSANGASQFFEHLGFAFEDLLETNDLQLNRIYVMGELKLPHPNTGDTLVTACCFANAVGDTIPPFLVFAGQIKANVVKKAPTHTSVTASADGKVDEETFLNVLQHFKEQVRVVQYRQVLLITDNEDEHEHISALQFCNKNGIILHSTPTKLSKKLHPLQRSIFQPVARVIAEVLEREQLTLEDLIGAFNQGYSSAFAPDRIVTAFKECDILPKESEIEKLKTAPVTGNGGSIERAKPTQGNVEDLMIEEEIEMTIDDSVNENESAVSRPEKYAITIVCHTCLAEFFDYQELVKHEKLHHTPQAPSELDGRSQFRYCDQWLASEHTEKVHVKKNVHCCPVCDELCDSKYALSRHREIHILKPISTS